ncbi:unnamed protein product [Acanthoscelides obtectus]|uniref:Uncharacterized protein n=1 Tax=Acanthoscelides obtectus TaxID=200917 RepID=A0A9P0P473_ACAOB|nr:unnamed protein product [Acanthoscelides obtectus]CAK1657632.1 hypothetical protein AOBTE_LOCUS20448 [Acanthoscelides obtectus]
MSDRVQGPATQTPFNLLRYLDRIHTAGSQTQLPTSHRPLYEHKLSPLLRSRSCYQITIPISN